MIDDYIMNIDLALKKLTYVGVLEFATVDHDGDPQVRNISAFTFDGTDMYFLTARGKSFARQLMDSGKVQVLGYTKYKETIRISGKAEQVAEDQQEKWIKRIYDEQPYLENVYPGNTRRIDTMFVIRNYTIEYFWLGSHPITREYFTVGNAVLKPKGYQISDRCISCGTCQRNCPQQVITAGAPFVIDQHHCLQCGNCFELCPVQAIDRIGE